MELKCAIIDDEPLARECIESYVSKVEFLRLVGVGNNPVELSRILAMEPVDLVFLDIQMPLMNGIDFLKASHNLPMIVITTAYPTYALEGYQLDVMDYLVKPITFNRFFMAINKVKDYYNLLSNADKQDPTPKDEPDYFFIKCGHRFERIYFSDILFIEALQNYVTIHTSKSKYITLLSLKNIQDKLDSRRFARVHKSYIVCIQKVESIENNDITIQKFKIPISRQYREEVLDKVVSDRLWKKE